MEGEATAKAPRRERREDDSFMMEEERARMESEVLDEAVTVRPAREGKERSRRERWYKRG